MKNWLSPTVEENVYTVLFNFLPLVDFFKMFSSGVLGPISLNHEEENRAKISWNCLFKLEKTLKNYRKLFWLRNVMHRTYVACWIKHGKCLLNTYVSNRIICFPSTLSFFSSVYLNNFNGAELAFKNWIWFYFPLFCYKNAYPTGVNTARLDWVPSL